MKSTNLYTFYDTYGNINNYTISNNTEIGKNIGKCGRVYSYDNESILKIYNKDCDYSGRIVPGVADIINAYNGKNLVKIDKLLFDYNYKKIDDDSVVSAYTRSYIEADGTNLVLMSKDYIKECVISLLKIGIYFAKKGILLEDLKYDNTIINKDGLSLIDPDTWFYCDYDYEDILDINTSRLINLLKEIYVTDLIKIINTKDFNYVKQIRDLLLTPNLYDTKKKVLKNI